MIAINGMYRSEMEAFLAQPGALDWVARDGGRGQLYGEKMLATAGARRRVYLAPVLAFAPDGRWPVGKNK